MAKKKKQQAKQPVMSPEKYIKTRGRSLPVYECLVRDGWQGIGLADIIIAEVCKYFNIKKRSFL